MTAIVPLDDRALEKKCPRKSDISSRYCKKRSATNSPLPSAVLHLVQVRHLWEDRYRVNVLVGGESASAKFLHSYFVVADLDGNVIESMPKITR